MDIDATTVYTYANLHAMTHPSNITSVYEELRDGKRVKELQVMAAVLVGWMACTEYINTTSTALETS